MMVNWDVSVSYFNWYESASSSEVGVGVKRPPKQRVTRHIQNFLRQKSATETSDDGGHVN